MRMPSRFALVAALLTPAALLADTPSTTQWIVTSAKVTGAGGNQYVSSLRLVNPNASVAPVDLTFLPASDGSGDNGTSQAKSVVVNAHSTLAIDDVLGSFGVTGAGGILVKSTGVVPVPVWALSQTLVVNALSSTGVPGTNGFAIPAQNTDQIVAAGETAYIPYVSSSSSATSGYRTNVFLLSADTTGSTTVTVKLLKGDGTVFGSRDITLARLAQTQINGIAGSFGYTANDTNLTATVTVVRNADGTGGPVATGASVIDNAISSISYSPPMKVAKANNGAFGVLLNDGFGFSGRLDIQDGSGEYMSMDIVVPSCAGSAFVFNFQAFGAVYGLGSNTNFVTNADGTISFSGFNGSTPQTSDASFSGTIYSNVDGSVYGNVSYTRATGPNGAPCPGVGLPAPYTFSGTKAFSLP
jgi:hypothetical protein